MRRGTLPLSGSAAALRTAVFLMLLAGCDDIKRGDKSIPVATKDVCLQLAVAVDDADTGNSDLVRADDIVFGSELMNDRKAKFDAVCEGRHLRGCLMPPEQYSKVEEYHYRKRHCQAPSKDCAELQKRIEGLRQEQTTLQQSKNPACRKSAEKIVSSQEELDRDRSCRYQIRRIAAVIDAIATNEVFFERSCF